jgi:hypothetical protein
MPRERRLDRDLRRLRIADLRRIERSPRAKVSPFFSLIGICVIPFNWYSTGSSIVMILSSIDLISESAP